MEKIMKIVKMTTFAFIVLSSFACLTAAQVKTTNAGVLKDLRLKHTPGNAAAGVIVYITQFDVLTSGADQNVFGNSIFGNTLNLKTEDFKFKLTGFVENGQVTIVGKQFLVTQEGTIGKIEMGHQLPVIKENSLNSDPTIEFINAGFLFKAEPTIIYSETNQPASVHLTLELTDNEVDGSLQSEGVPVVITREIKNTLTLDFSDTKILGGFTSKDGKTRRYFAVSTALADDPPCRYSGIPAAMKNSK